MDNWKLLDNESASSDGRVGVSKYGFDVPTCCGYLPQKNEWCEDWVEFYCRKIDHQFEMLDKPVSTNISIIWLCYFMLWVCIVCIVFIYKKKNVCNNVVVRSCTAVG